MHKQVKCKTRVADHGEVFTAEREVNAMLNLVKHETERIESRFLEPACGTGNFLLEVLRRKLEVVKSRYKKNQLDYERNAVIAVSSIYGIDLLEDNVEECRCRLYDLFDAQYTKLFKERCQEACRQSVRYILDRNIIQGDALTFKRTDRKGEPIIFSEWSPVNSVMIKRRDYSFEILHNTQFGSDAGLFSDLGEEAFIPDPVKEYPVTHFLRLAEHG
ncbi:DNA methyltransferase [Hydrogenimonas urashimensis]|uniref:DNA methyltransferase n=1 Tax=Hydrogenimonas urashimensis TaxID=2740515 RepID=UPI0019151549|nr:DNA methyltransferase [Hydrogenimonas urashimensis]